MLARSLALGLALASSASTLNAQVTPGWSDTQSWNTTFEKRTYIRDVVAHPGGGIVATSVVNGFVLYPTTGDVGEQLVRWSATGQKLWVRDLTTAPALRGPIALVVDANGTSYVAGGTASGTAIHAVDAAGNVSWVAAPGGDISIRALAILPSAGILAVGGRNGAQPKIWVSALSSTGATLWTTEIDGPGGAGYNSARCVAVDVGGNITIAGQFGAGSHSDIAVARLDASGNIVWTQTLAGPLYPWAEASSIAIAPNGDCLVGGSVQANNGYPAYLARLDSNGALVWEHIWSSFTPVRGEVRQTAIATDGSTWSMVRGQGSPPARTFIGFLHCAVDGTLLAAIHCDPPGDDDTVAQSFVLGNAGQIHALATVLDWPTQTSDGLLLAIDSVGGILWQQPFDATPPSGYDSYYGLARIDEDRFVVGGTSSIYAGGVGIVRVFDTRDSPHAYCTGKTNSLGCTPQMSFEGSSSATATSGFVVRANQELNQKSGMLIYSLTGAAALPFQGGTLCVQSQVRRTPVQTAGGSTPPIHDCSGSFALDFNAFAHGLAGGNPDAALLAPGTSVWVQAWGRDPALTSSWPSSLSNGLRFVVLP